MSPRTASATRLAPAAAPTAAPAPTPAPTATPIPSASYHGLKVWQRAMDLVTAVYALTQALPSGEDGLRSELRRTALLVPAQIAAGNAFFQRAEHVQHVSDALGAVARVECLLQTAERLGALPAPDVLPVGLLSIEVGRLLRGLLRSLQTKRGPELVETVN